MQTYDALKKYNADCCCYICKDTSVCIKYIINVKTLRKNEQNMIFIKPFNNLCKTKSARKKARTQKLSTF